MNKLAINGGTPIRTKLLPYGKQCIDNDDIESVVSVLKSEYLTTGPNVEAFESSICEFTSAKYAVALSNGTAALHAACMAAGIKNGDEVITSAITFAASSNAVLYCGGKPIFADIDPKTLNIDINEIEKNITKKTKAIIPVHFTGEPCKMDEIKKLADKYNLIVIEDAAHALGAEYKGQKIGSISDMTEFSLHPVKNITTGEGGVVTTNSKILYDKLKLFRGHGITRDKDIMNNYQGNWYYEQIDLGYNYRITDLQCALGISQLKKLDTFMKRREEIVNIYNKELNEVKGLTIKEKISDIKSGNHLYVIQLNLEELRVDRNMIYKALIAENIGVNVHYIPVYLHPYYQKLGYEKGLCKKAEQVYERILTLPLFPNMNDADIYDVIEGVNKVLNFFWK